MPEIDEAHLQARRARIGELEAEIAAIERRDAAPRRTLDFLRVLVTPRSGRSLSEVIKEWREQTTALEALERKPD